jgi:hypothetical protein
LFGLLLHGEAVALTRRTEWLAPMMSEFLNDPSPKATWPTPAA